MSGKVQFRDLSKPLQAAIIKGWVDLGIAVLVIVLFIVGLVIVVAGG